jgi:L-lactate dehydrogenase complex protein LldE
MVREQYPRLFENDPVWESHCRKVAGRTFEFVEFLTVVLKVDLSPYTLPEPLDLTYHYNCHLRGLGIRDQAERMLRQIGNVNLRPMEKTDQCCGFGGTFAVKYPRISQAMVDDKVACIAKTGAGTLVCNDAGCSMNISGMCHRKGMETRVTHIAEIIARAIGA